MSQLNPSEISSVLKDKIAGLDLKATTKNAGNIAVISLNRPKAANAQSLALIYALDEALQKALVDPSVRVIVL